MTECGPVLAAMYPTANVVSVGAGVPSTVNVCPSNAAPVPATLYKEPTTGIVSFAVAVNVKVRTSEAMVYDVMASCPVALLVVARKLGGAPGPTCDRGRKSNWPVAAFG